MQVSYSPINSNETCGICRETVGWGIAHNQQHPMHAKCMKAWAQVQATCPTCRASVDKSSILTLTDRVTNELTAILKDGFLGAVMGVTFYEAMDLIARGLLPETTNPQNLILLIISAIGTSILLSNFGNKIKEKVRETGIQEGFIPSLVRKTGDTIPLLATTIMGSFISMGASAVREPIGFGIGLGLFYGTSMLIRPSISDIEFPQLILASGTGMIMDLLHSLHSQKLITLNAINHIILTNVAMRILSRRVHGF